MFNPLNFFKMRKSKTMRTILLNFVDVAGRNLNENHWGIGYLDQVSSGSVCFPTRNDSRYLSKDANGMYHLVYA